MREGTIEKAIHIAAPRELVWDYLTKSSELAKWFHRPEADLSDAQAFNMIGKDGSSLCGGEVEVCGTSVDGVEVVHEDRLAAGGTYFIGVLAEDAEVQVLENRRYHYPSIEVSLCRRQTR